MKFDAGVGENKYVDGTGPWKYIDWNRMQIWN